MEGKLVSDSLAPAFQTGHVTVYLGDALATLKQIPDETVDSVVTSPPYWGLRDYGVPGQLGLEPSMGEYIDAMVTIFAEVRRVLREHGTLWLNMGDSYAQDGKWGGAGDGSADAGVNIPGRAQFPRTKKRTGLKPKDMVGMPWRIAFALQEDGWYLRSDIVWAKPNPMPESIRDRPTKSHEYVFLFAKTGNTHYWTHQDGRLVSNAPAPDYVWRLSENTSVIRHTMPDGWNTDKEIRRQWRRENLWVGHDYYYDADAIAEPLTAASLARLSQASFNLQQGGPKDYGRIPAGDSGDGAHTKRAGRYSEINASRSARKAIENLHAKTIVPVDPLSGPLWNTPGQNSRAHVDRDPRHLDSNPITGDPRDGESKRRLYKTDEHNRFGKASANRVWEDGDSLDRMIVNGRNARTVWEIATQPYPEAHFATFPEELPRRCIAAGTPERVCTQCGKPSTRVTKTEYQVRAIRADTEKQADTGASGARANMPFMGDAATTTLGWTDCGHDAYVPGTVLDPFAGSGTTLQVARDLGRLSIGIELHADYLDLIVRRCQQEAFSW